jgi:hypothetical protein
MLDIDIKVGCTGIFNTQWGKSFYPDDLPDDWKLDYYANEFSIILLNSRDDNNYLSELDDSLSAGFHLLIIDNYFDINQGTINQRTIEKEIILNPNDSVIINAVCEFSQLNGFDSLSKAPINNNIAYCYQLNALLKPMELKVLIDFCIDDSDIEDDLENKPTDRIIYLFFDNNKYAIENARNMNILIQML